MRFYFQKVKSVLISSLGYTSESYTQRGSITFDGRFQKMPHTLQIAEEHNVKYFSIFEAFL